METTAAEEKQPSLMSRFNDGNLGEQEGDDSSYREVSLHPMCWLISCPIFHCGLCPYRTVLYFEAKAMTRRDVSLCGRREVYVPYREIQSVDQSQCCCLSCVDMGGGLGTIMPSMGCERQECRRIGHILQTRLKDTADIGDLNKRFAHMERHNQELKDRLNWIVQHLPAVPDGTSAQDSTGASIVAAPPVAAHMTDRTE